MIKLNQIEYKKNGKKGFMLPGRVFTTSAHEALEVLNKIDTMTASLKPVYAKVFVKPSENQAVVTRIKSNNARVFL